MTNPGYCRNCNTRLVDREGRHDWCAECLAFNPEPVKPPEGTPEEIPELIVWVPCPSCKSSPLLPTNAEGDTYDLGCPNCHHVYKLNDVTKLSEGV